MNSKALQFVNAVLGQNGVPLVNLAKHNSDIEAYLLPRVVVSWLKSVVGVQDSIPGSDISMVLAKSEHGFSGVIDIDGIGYSFKDASIDHTTATVVTAFGEVINKSELKNSDLAKLGKTIDLLVKSKKEHEHGTQEVAKPIEPIDHIKPTPVAPKASKAAKPKRYRIPKIPKVASLKLSERQMFSSCPVCGLKQFYEKSFVGCHCFSSLSKSVKSVIIPGGVELKFGDEWDDEAITTLLESVNAK